MRRTAFLSTSFIDDNSNPPLYFGSRGSSVRIRPPRYSNCPLFLPILRVKSFIDEDSKHALLSLSQAQAFHLEPDKNRTVTTFTWAGALGATRLSVQGHFTPVQRRTNGRPILPPAFKQRREQRGETVDDNEIKEILNGEFDLDITNFKDHNPGKTTAWFKLKNDWFLDPKLITLPPSARLLFVCLMTVRATRGELIRGCTSRALQLRVGCARRDIRVDLLSLCKKGLIFLAPSLERKKERKERGDEERFVEKTGLIIPDLVGIDDPLFSSMSEAAQRSWVGKFGLELIRDIAPTAHTSWKTDNPVNPRSGVAVPLIPYVHRWLENGKRFPQKPKEKTFAEALAEREAKREPGNF